jgi:hypothetical protein
MRTPSFLIEKANQYISIIDDLQKNPLPKYSGSFSESPEKEKVRNAIDDIKLKIKLLLHEFDNSQPFIERIRSIDEDRHDNMMGLIDGEERTLPKYKHTLSLFIEHLSEYRVNQLVDLTHL